MAVGTAGGRVVAGKHELAMAAAEQPGAHIEGKLRRHLLDPLAVLVAIATEADGHRACRLANEPCRCRVGLRGVQSGFATVTIGTPEPRIAMDAT